MRTNPTDFVLRIALLLCLCAAASAQQAGATPEGVGQEASTSLANTGPTVTFTRDWPKADPPYYKIVVQSNGSADYSSRTSPTADAAQSSSAENGNGASDQPYSIQVKLSEAARQQIFALAQQANYFNGSFNYDHHKVADTGAKTLAYSDAARHYQTAYNWSENNAIDDLTHLFEGISLTLESGEQLRHLMRFDKLGLNAQLAGMEQAAAGGQLREIALIAPVLNQIASDSAYMHIAQERARHLLALAAK